mgnify:CR=1 FL=1
MISIPFFTILILTVILYWLIPRQSIRNILLILSSLTFIYLLDRWSVLVVVGLSLLSFGFGHLISKHPKKSWIHTMGVILVLGVLIAFKYLGFLNGIYNSMAGFILALPRFEIKALLLPLGISYIVFKHISYLTDIRWGLVKPGRFLDFLLYSCLFTIFVAGPIERWERLKPQIEVSRIQFSWSYIDHGFGRIVLGMFKKLVIADWLGYLINPVWNEPHQYSAGIGLLALLGYSFQIYYDFSGYSDVAIGSSKLLGVKIMENFNNPYLAQNISQFWRRWHISLSDWIRDYLFFPLSRLSSKSIWTVFFVPIIAMSLCGLWHGPTWHFIVWGAWHGLGLFVLQLWNETKRSHRTLAKATKANGFYYTGIAMNFSFVSVGWWLFR